MGQINTIKSCKKRAKLTRNILKKKNDWYLWEAAEYKQLQQYEDHEIFTILVPIPEGDNKRPFIWTYVIKDDGTYKAKLPCYGSP